MHTTDQKADRRIVFYLVSIATIWTAILMTACAKQAVAPTKGNLAHQSALSAEVAGLLPGLSVRYYNGRFRHIDQMPSGSREMQWGKAGNPIRVINHRFGTGNVFDSGTNQKVGVLMSGYIHFDSSGSYRLRARSNDGVRIWIGETVVVDDPDVHSDRVIDSQPLEIARAGWYPFKLKYFQNKGSATLELYWQPPGAREFAMVPEAAYGHHPQ